MDEGKCIYWRNSQCHRFPPNTYGEFPHVPSDCWCGEKKIEERNSLAKFYELPIDFYIDSEDKI